MLKQNLFAAFVVLASVPAATGCRALLDGDDLALHAEDGSGGRGNTGQGGNGAGSPSSSGTQGTSTGGPGAGGTSSSSSATSSSDSSSSVSSSTGDGGASTTTATSTTSTGSGGGTTCGDAIEATIDFNTTYQLTTTNAGGDAAAVCVHDGPSRFIQITPQGDGYLSVWIRRDGTDYNSALGLGAACNVPELCANNLIGNPNGAENAVIAAKNGIPVWIAVSGSTPSDVGTFSLEATLDKGVCSDPIELHVEASSSGAVASIDLTMLNNHINGSCGGTGADVVFRVTGTDANAADVSMFPQDFDAVLHARPACDMPESGCSNVGAVGATEELSLTLNAPVYLFADSQEPGALFTMLAIGN